MICLRVDDFPGTKPEEFWKHNLDNFKRFNDVLEKHSVPEYVLGIIPKHTTQEHIDYITSNQMIVPALHGIDHDERFQNEFRDHQTEQDVCQAIMSAKWSLDATGGHPIDIYIPPHNVIDTKTCDALKKCGFKILMGGPGMDAREILHATNLGLRVFYSRWPCEYGRSDELLNRDKSVEHFADNQLIFHMVLCIHWTWEYNIGLENLERYLDAIRESGVYFSSLQ